MTKTKTLALLGGLPILFFLVSCTTMVKVNLVEDVSNPNAPKHPTQIEVFKSPDQVPDEYDVIGQVSVSDTGFSVACGFSSMIKSIQEKAVIAKADGAYLTEVSPPSVWSTCYQGSANLIVYRNGQGKFAKGRSAKKSEGVSSGSGFLIDSEGRVATNYHVIEGKESIRIYIGEDGTDYQATVVVSDTANDIAILKIDDKRWKKRNSIQHKFRPSNGVMIGEDVFTMGFPLGPMLGTNVRLTKGSVSSKAGIMDDVRMFQMTTAIQPGNSGGPLIDMNGNIVGIVVATLSPSLMLKYTGTLPQNINFAIKIDYLISLAEMNDIHIKLPRANRSLSEARHISEIAKQMTHSIVRIVAE